MKEPIHKAPHPMAGKAVKIKAAAKHPQVPSFGGSEFRVEDYWDRLGQGSWMDCKGNFACVIYAIRSAQENLPIDDEVLYGKIGCLGHIVHISEIEQSTTATV